MRNVPSQRLLLWLIGRRVLLLIVALVLSAAGAIVSWNLRMDRTLQRLFAPGDPWLAPYEQLKSQFGQHDIVLAIYEDSELNSQEGLTRSDQLAGEIRALPGVVAAVSLVDVPGLAEKDRSGLRTDQRAEHLQRLFSGYTHSAQLNSAGIVCLLERASREAPASTNTLDQLRHALAEYPHGRLVGEPVLLGEAFDLLEADGRRLNTWCLGLLLLVIFLCYRQLRWLVLPLVLVQVALAMTRGMLVLIGIELSMVSSMLAAIVTVVAVATVMHVIVRYRDQREAGRSPRAALLQAGRLLMAPVFFACLTDAVGFASLMLSEVQPVKDFGLMMAIGSLMVLVAIALTVPAIILCGNRLSARQHDIPPSMLRPHLHALYRWSRQHRVALTMLLFAVTNGAVIGSTWLQQETNFIHNFRQHSDLAANYRFVDGHFGGAGVWDLMVPAPTRLDKQYVRRVLAFEDRLREQAPELSNVLSLADLLDAGTGGIDQLAFGADMAIRAGLGLMRGRMPEFVATLYNPRADVSEHYFRILLRAPENLGAQQKAHLIDQVNRLAREEFPESQVTGFYVLLTHLIESLLRDQWTTFAGAAFGILLVMTWAFRSVRLALVTLIPNVLPVVWLFGAMGLVGVPINMGAAMIAAVSLGLSVDGSIHYVISYQRLRREGASVDQALESVQATVGRATILGTLALVVGFSTLAASEFVPTIYFGTLVSLSMIGGLVGNLIALPLLIHWIEGKPRRAPGRG